jgi:hypothetical protein
MAGRGGGEFCQADELIAGPIDAMANKAKSTGPSVRYFVRGGRRSAGNPADSVEK